jgi:phospholipid transport system transporter-binding protein
MYRPAENLTVNNAKEALEAGLHAIAAGQARIDLSELTVVDSAAVATLLAWKRAAHKRRTELVFTNFAANLQSLVNLYEVTGLLQSVHVTTISDQPAHS